MAFIELRRYHKTPDKQERSPVNGSGEEKLTSRTTVSARPHSSLSLASGDICRDALRCSERGCPPTSDSDVISKGILFSAKWS